MPYVRTVRTAAHDDAELAVLKAAAGQRLAAGQGELPLGPGSEATCPLSPTSRIADLGSRFRQTWRRRLIGMRYNPAGGAPDLTHQQLVRADQRERGPRRDRPPDRRRLSDGDVSGQACDTADHEQQPREHPAPAT